mmetsp:Transcript_16883/g.32959  ORF Transcript_16883/g.32959 Transcript_16883/m.32959 type:complete len:162 (+) Transcript_16883:1511-1996(+)
MTLRAIGSCGKLSDVTKTLCQAFCDSYRRLWKVILVTHCFKAGVAIALAFLQHTRRWALRRERRSLRCLQQSGGMIGVATSHEMHAMPSMRCLNQLVAGWGRRASTEPLRTEQDGPQSAERRSLLCYAKVGQKQFAGNVSLNLQTLRMLSFWKRQRLYFVL